MLTVLTSGLDIAATERLKSITLWCNILVLIRTSLSVHEAEAAYVSGVLVQECREQKALIGDGLNLEGNRGERERSSHRR